MPTLLPIRAACAAFDCAPHEVLMVAAQRPAAGRNHFMMAHGGIFREATGFSVQQAQAVVLEPSHLRVIVARTTPEE
jgi:hypothetical protein